MQNLWEIFTMKFTNDEELDKFIDEVIMTADNPVLEAVNIITEFYKLKIAKLEKEIAELKGGSS